MLSARAQMRTTTPCPRPPEEVKPDAMCETIGLCFNGAAVNAETLAAMSDFLVEQAVIVRDSNPECVPSIIGVDIALDGDHGAAVKLLVTEEAIVALLRCITGMDHALKRIHTNTLLYVALSYMTAFTSMSEGGPGSIPVTELDPDRVNPSPCSGQGIYSGTQCLCGPHVTGDKCQFFVDPDQAYQDGWRKGYEASMANITAFSKPKDVVQEVSTMFDSAAKLLKSTTMNMAKLDTSCEARVSTLYLSPVEILFGIEDPTWLEQYRSCPTPAFAAVVPKVLKESMLLRREYDDIAIMLKHLAIKASTLDCKSMQMLAIRRGGNAPLCGDVAQILTEMDKMEIMEKCLTDPIVAELQTLLRMENSAPMKHVVDDMLELINVVLLHSQCPGQCSRRGVCLLRQCECFEGWTGLGCTHEVPLPDGMCPRNCTGHGKCIEGRCKCDPGWKSYDCSYSTACPNNCWQHGDCIDGTCHCFRRWRGYDCSLPREICPDDFKCLHGVCVDSRCVCEEGWTGDDCTIGNFVAKKEDGFWDDEAEVPSVFL